MKLILESPNVNAYLENTEVINFHDPVVAQKISEIQATTSTVETQAALAFDFVRDQVRHSFDVDALKVTVAAPEVLTEGVGICFAKAHLLAALFRGLGIPTGFCYQRVMRKGTPESGFALHGLNAAYFPQVGWVRLDPRGDRAGVHSEFNLHVEHLAYTLNLDAGEVDYPFVYTRPLSSVLRSMWESTDCHELFYLRPPQLEVEEMLA
ncbi:transglutaminase family protein [Alicyclobacillaceae bacterium I2511]|nr:transglutaminase family protein [Alicyclobacillaceae bacterium I2511]